MKLNIYKQNYQIVIEYDGSKFVGWQLQKNGKSIQGEIQKVIKQVFGRYFRENITGSGRTDAGVHALGQVAHIYLPSNHPLTSKPPFYIISAFNSFRETLSISQSKGAISKKESLEVKFESFMF